MHRLIVVALVVAFAGCLGGPGDFAGGADAAVASRAPVTVENRDDISRTLSLESSVGGAEVDRVKTTLAANASKELTIGLPGKGNVQLRLVDEATGKRAETSLAVTSCKSIRIGASVENGQPGFHDIVCL